MVSSMNYNLNRCLTNEKSYPIWLWISCYCDEMEEIQAQVDRVADFLVDLANKTLT